MYMVLEGRDISVRLRRPVFQRSLPSNEHVKNRWVYTYIASYVFISDAYLSVSDSYILGAGLAQAV
jgi:hypothetical protein